MHYRLPGIRVSVFLAGMFLLFNSCSKTRDQEQLVITPTVNPVPYSVLVYLITPTDQTFNPDYYKAARSCLLSLQDWYKSQMGNRTFVLNPVIVDTLTGLHNSSWFNDNHGDSISGAGSRYAYYNTLYEMRQLLGAKFDTTHYIYFAYVAADFPDETQPRGLAAEGLGNLKGLLSQFPDSWKGAAGHALGHAFGLPEPQAPTAEGIMSTGWTNFPKCTLEPAEKDSLGATPFFQE